jgi:hypothetical protein
LSNPSQHFKKPSSFSSTRSHCSTPDSELKGKMTLCPVAIIPCQVELLVSCRYGNAVEDYLNVYLRTPDLPKDDIARALVARGRARKGAGQKLLLMASRGQYPLRCRMDEFCSLRPHCLSTLHPTPRRLPDGLDFRPFKPRTRVLLAPRARRESRLSYLRSHLFITSRRSPFQAFPHPNAFRRKFGTRSQASYHGTSSARGSSYPPSIAISQSVASSAPSTYTSVKTLTAGIGR